MQECLRGALKEDCSLTHLLTHSFNRTFTFCVHYSVLISKSMMQIQYRLEVFFLGLNNFSNQLNIQLLSCKTKIAEKKFEVNFLYINHANGQDIYGINKLDWIFFISPLEGDTNSG